MSPPTLQTVLDPLRVGQMRVRRLETQKLLRNLLPYREMNLFDPPIYLGGNYDNHNAAAHLHHDMRLVAVVPALYLLWETATFA